MGVFYWFIREVGVFYWSFLEFIENVALLVHLSVIGVGHWNIFEIHVCDNTFLHILKTFVHSCRSSFYHHVCE